MSVTPELAFQQTIPRRLVHRAAVAEVFLTDAVVIGMDHFLVGAQWPRDHALYHPDSQGRSDPLLFAETIRQALVYLAHWHYDVPLGFRFVGRDMDLEITDPGALRVGSEPLPVTLEARWTRVGNDSPRRQGMKLEVVLAVMGAVCGRGSLTLFAVDEKYYRRLRRRTRQDERPADDPVARRQRVPAATVGRLRYKDSVLVQGDTAGEWLLRADLDHAILFDHPTDHLPLMVLLEGFRQLGHLLVHDAEVPQPERSASSLVLLTTECLAWAELDEPTRLLVRADSGVREGSGARRLCIEAVQGDAVVMASEMVWAPDGRGASEQAAGLLCPLGS
ncbi:ScbA/BarX family gamma-butyrolactone biosynthesis protein [Streptomyces violascens]|uniref:ScbA/BarX family gamma-butyrolactone biosynthesis protein n=1 Tax=Streptomyces violascens TaxID=67381 RepID=UPI00378C53C1